jgi:Raf kinase inhibitor-like YbhB/YbcL family protein
MRYLFVMLVCAAAFSTSDMEVTSKAFRNDATIPQKYSCSGDHVNPPLTIRHIPFGTRTLALIVDHLGQPNGTETEWIAWNIIPDGVISEGNMPGITGKNSFGERKWHGPCEKGFHRYHFRVYALDKTLCLDENSDRAALETAMSGHIIASSVMTGTFGVDNDAYPPRAE